MNFFFLRCTFEASSSTVLTAGGGMSPDQGKVPSPKEKAGGETGLLIGNTYLESLLTCVDPSQSLKFIRRGGFGRGRCYMKNK